MSNIVQQSQKQTPAAPRIDWPLTGNERYPGQYVFPRFASHCDRCDEALKGFGTFSSAEIETVAGNFKFTLCSQCLAAERRSNAVARDRMIKRAAVRRAARYSPELADFVSRWFFGASPKAVRE